MDIKDEINKLEEFLEDTIVDDYDSIYKEVNKIYHDVKKKEYTSEDIKKRLNQIYTSFESLQSNNGKAKKIIEKIIK